MAENQDQYYAPYLPSDSELSDADSDFTQSPPPSPRPTDAEAEEDQSQDLGPDFAGFAQALQAPQLKEPFDLASTLTSAATAAAAALSQAINPGALTLKNPSAAAGPTLATEAQQIYYGKNDYGRGLIASAYPFQDVSGLTLQSTSKSTDVVISLQSSDRDSTIYPVPTSCTLKLPRTYSNVTQVGIAQINLTSAFFYFSPEKQNVGIQIYENNRLKYPFAANSPTDSNGALLPLYTSSGTPVPLVVTNNIRPGSYNIDQLLSEIQLQLNRTPLFYDYPNGFSDFLPLFSVNGDYSINFNYPGDTYYDSLRKVYIQNPTRAQIVSYYFNTQYANLFTYTVGQVRIAYYYPVLKELLLDTSTAGIALATSLSLVNLGSSGVLSYTRPQIIQYILYNFTGINDSVVSEIVVANATILDQYRLQNTFRYSLINEYTCSYNQTNNYVTIQSSSLNSSLTSLLTTQYNSILNQQLANYNLTAAEYTNLSLTTTNLLSVIQSMYDYIQVNLATYFAINYGTFSAVYYTIPTNTILLRQGFNAANIASRYDASVAAQPRSIDLLNDFRKTPPHFWTGMSNLGNVELSDASGNPIRNMGNAVGAGFPVSSNYPYNLAQSNIDLTRSFVNANGDIYTDARRSAGDILVNVDAGKYTVFQFRSQYRQTLQVETLPRQTQFVYPAYNKNNIISANLSNLFDISYAYVDPAAGSPLFSKMTYDLSYNAIYGWSNLKGTSTYFGANFTTSSNLWSTSNEKIDIANSNGRYYKFQTPVPPTAAGATTTYPFNVSFVSSNFPSLMYAFFYHDQAAFNADVGPSNIRNESPYHYKFKLTIPANSSSNIYSFQAYANQTYYILLRPDSLTPSSTVYKIIPWFTSSAFTTLQNITNFNPQQDPKTMLNNVNVAIAQDSNFLRLPISSNLWASNTPATASINALLGVSPPVIGYDTNQVSSDLTDYIPFLPAGKEGSPPQNINPAATIRADPTNNYIFQLNTPYDVVYQTYFPSGTNNSLLTPQAGAPYKWKGATTRQYKIVQYYSTTYLPDSSTALTYQPTDISPYIQPYTLTTTPTAISPFNYQGTNQTLILGSGVCGFTFLPGDGTWAIDRIVFKTNFVSPSVQNAAILILGVFFTSEILSQPTSYISLENAVAICVKQRDTLYTQNGLNIGFDANLGTYSTFSNVPALVSRTNFNITGFNQSAKIFIADSNAYYSVIAFTTSAAASNAANTSNWSALAPLLTTVNGTSLTYIQNLTGTPIAYPYANTPTVSQVFYGNPNYIATNSLVLSTSNGNSSVYGPPSGADESVSQYEQSVPIVNSHIHYLDPANIISQSTPLPFSTWTSLPVQPTALGTSVPNTLLLQASGFAIVNYSTYTTVNAYTDPARVFRLQGELTVQQIFPDHEVTSLLAFSGTSFDYIFLGASNIPGSLVSQLRFKRYNPATGVMTELPKNPYYTFSNSFQIQQFVFHNTNRWFISSTDQNNVYLQGDTTYSPTTNTLITKPYVGKAVSELAMDCSGSYLYFATGATPGFGPQSGFTTLQLFTFDPTDTLGFVRSTPGYTLIPQGSALPAYYKQFAVDKTATTEELLLTNTDVYPNNFFKVNNFQPVPADLSQSNININISAAKFQTDASTFIVPTRLYGGAKGSKWALFDSPPFVQGNRYDAYDAPTSLSIAWQIFFPTIKIEMRKLSSGSTPITDLTSLNYPEWPHTAMFAYSSAAALSNDLSNPPWDRVINAQSVTFPASGKWGLESSNNFMVCDASFNGFYFNSYMMNVPLVPSVSNTYYIAIRGWLPTEKFQTLMRFYLPNRYDFGFARITDLSGEILIAQNPAGAAFNPVYLTTLLSFNSNFVFAKKNFGSNATQGFIGSNLASTGFGNFLATYRSLYATFTSNTTILQTVSSNVQIGLNNFIASNLQYIIPIESQTRQRFTDSLLFQIQWASILQPTYAAKYDQWGLGWNLGFPKEDTGLSTVQSATTFYRIQQDYIYLRLNPEFNINRMDAGGKESYITTREPTGTTNQYYCKLLLTSFGGNATTFIHNPVTFNPPLFRLTQMEFQWIDSQSNVITNIDAEWDMVVNLTELSFQTSLPMLSNYNPGQYIKTPDPIPAGLAVSTIRTVNA